MNGRRNKRERERTHRGEHEAREGREKSRPTARKYVDIVYPIAITASTTSFQSSRAEIPVKIFHRRFKATHRTFKRRDILPYIGSCTLGTSNFSPYRTYVHTYYTLRRIIVIFEIARTSTLVQQLTCCVHLRYRKMMFVKHVLFSSEIRERWTIFNVTEMIAHVVRTRL